MNQSVASGLLYVPLIFISYEVWFTLCWNAYRYWCPESPVQFMKFLAWPLILESGMQWMGKKL